MTASASATQHPKIPKQLTILENAPPLFLEPAEIGRIKLLLVKKPGGQALLDDRVLPIAKIFAEAYQRGKRDSLLIPETFTPLTKKLIQAYDYNLCSCVFNLSIKITEFVIALQSKSGSYPEII